MPRCEIILRDGVDTFHMIDHPTRRGGNLIFDGQVIRVGNKVVISDNVWLVESFEPDDDGLARYVCVPLPPVGEERLSG